MVVPYPDRSFRMRGDYKVTITPVLKVDQYLLPTPENLFATFAGRSVSPNLTYHKLTSKWN